MLHAAALLRLVGRSLHLLLGFCSTGTADCSKSKKLVKDAINNSGAIDEGKLKRSMNSK